MNIEDILQRRYRAFENIDKGWDFFIYLNDYIQCIYKTQEIKEFIKKIEDEKKEEYKKYYKLKDKVFKEIIDSKEELLQIIKENKINEDSLVSIEEFKSYERGLDPEESLSKGRKLYLSGLRVETDNEMLSDIAKELLQKGYGKLIDKFIINNCINDVHVDEKLTFSKTYKEFFNEKKRIEYIKKDKIWNCWYHLKFIPEIFNSSKFGFHNVITDIKKEISEEDVNYVVDFGMINAKQKTSNYAFEPSTNEGFEEEIKIYKKYVKRLHLYFLEELSILKVKAKKEKTVKTVYGDGILFFKEVEFNFNNKPIQKDLLDTLFKKPKVNWSNDEIWEDWGERDFMGETLKFYTAGNEINKTIAMELKIKDFIIKNTKQIRINPKYI